MSLFTNERGLTRAEVALIIIVILTVIAALSSVAIGLILLNEKDEVPMTAISPIKVEISEGPLSTSSIYKYPLPPGIEITGLSLTE